jgi:fatty-acyl-CoA synthase
MYPIEFLWRAARRFPERTAVLGSHGPMCFRELARRVLIGASTIAALDPIPGSMVGVGASNSVDHLVGILAVLAAGKVWVPLNPRNGDPEIHRQVEFIGPRLILADEAMASRLTRHRSMIHLLSNLTRPSTAEPTMDPIPNAQFELDCTQAVKFTGGTTGFPKGVKQPIRAWNANIVTQIHMLGLGPQDRYLIAAPLTHGTSTYILPILGSGGALIFPEEPKAAGLLAATEQHHATLCFAPPTLILSLLEEQSHAPRKIDSLRCLIYGGAPMRAEQIRDVQACFGQILGTSYGQTEAPQIASFLAPDEMVGGRLASAGRASLLTQIGILAEDGTSLACGEQGEIAIRGDLCMTGYLDAPEETARVLVNGWLRTGDVGVLDDQGFLYLKDRLRDVIITGGFNVYPCDIEVVIAADTAVADCSVIGVPDAKWGEVVHAAVALKPGAAFDRDELKAAIKRELGSVKTPKEIHVFENLPRSAVGKILKTAIRAEIVRRQTILLKEVTQ